MSEGEKVRHEISKWRKVDILAPILILVFSCFSAAYPYYQILMLVAIPFLLVIVFIRPLYYKDNKHGKAFKNAVTVIRIIGYTVVVSAVILPFTMNNSWKWYYSVQKLIYGVDAKTEQFLPDHIPENAENYKVIFCRSGFPGASRIEMSFFTDSKTLAEYRDKAIENGAATGSEKVSKNRWYAEMEEQGIPYEQAEYYFYPDENEYSPKVYILEETTGYVKIYY